MQGMSGRADAYTLGTLHRKFLDAKGFCVPQSLHLQRGLERGLAPRQEPCPPQFQWATPRRLSPALSDLCSLSDDRRCKEDLAGCLWSGQRLQGDGTLGSPGGPWRSQKTQLL